MNFIDKNPHKMSILNGNYHERFWDVLDSKFGSLLCHLFFLWSWSCPLISELFHYLFNEDNHFNTQLLSDCFISNLLISETLLWVCVVVTIVFYGSSCVWNVYFFPPVDNRQESVQKTCNSWGGRWSASNQTGIYVTRDLF